MQITVMCYTWSCPWRLYGNHCWYRMLECSLRCVIMDHVILSCSIYTGFPFASKLHSKCWYWPLKSLYDLGSTYLKDHLLPYEPTCIHWSFSEFLLQLPLPQEPRWVATWERAFMPKLWNSCHYRGSNLYLCLLPAGDDVFVLSGQFAVMLLALLLVLFMYF